MPCSFRASPQRDGSVCGTGFQRQCAGGGEGVVAGVGVDDHVVSRHRYRATAADDVDVRVLGVSARSRIDAHRTVAGVGGDGSADNGGRIAIGQAETATGGDTGQVGDGVGLRAEIELRIRTGERGQQSPGSHGAGLDHVAARTGGRNGKRAGAHIGRAQRITRRRGQVGAAVAGGGGRNTACKEVDGIIARVADTTAAGVGLQVEGAGSDDAVGAVTIREAARVKVKCFPGQICRGSDGHGAGAVAAAYGDARCTAVVEIRNFRCIQIQAGTGVVGIGRGQRHCGGGGFRAYRQRAGGLQRVVAGVGIEGGTVSGDGNIAAAGKNIRINALRVARAGNAEGLVLRGNAAIDVHGPAGGQDQCIGEGKTADGDSAALRGRTDVDGTEAVLEVARRTVPEGALCQLQVRAVGGVGAEINQRSGRLGLDIQHAGRLNRQRTQRHAVVDESDGGAGTAAAGRADIAAAGCTQAGGF